MASYTDIVNSLPRPIRLRFDSIGSFVQTIIAEQEDRLSPPERLSREDHELIKLAVFAYALNQLFREGSAAARAAVDEFQHLGVFGFQIGATSFEGRNDNVRLGDTLADKLMKCFEGTPLYEEITNARGLSELTLTVIRKVHSG